jgi:hypothetical protein
VVVIEGEIYEREGFDRPMARLTKAFSLNEIRQKRANIFKFVDQRFHDNNLSRFTKIFYHFAMSICVSISRANCLTKIMRQLNYI